jgi:hypothetical protein
MPMKKAKPATVIWLVASRMMSFKCFIFIS